MANYQNTGMNQGLYAASQNTINLSGLSGSSTNPWTAQTISLSDLEVSFEPHVKKYQVLEIEEDLLALSCTWKRLRDEHNKGGAYSGISKLVDKELFNKVTDIDRELAATIRDFYSKKIVMWKLKGQNLSKFREDMNLFIHSNGKVFKEDICPLAYRLPEFYEYDTGFQTLADEHTKIISNELPHGKVQKILTLKKKFLVNRRNSKIMEYWFADENNNLVKIAFSHDNTLLSLLDKCSNEGLAVYAFYTKRTRDNIEYWVADKYKFV